MKRIILLFLCLVLLFCTSLPVLASEQKIIDHAGLLDESEIEELESQARRLSTQYGMDIVIVTVHGLEGKSSESYADDFYDENGYGLDSENSGILLLLSMEDRDWAISTCGKAIYAFTDYGIQSIFSEMSNSLSQDQYYLAFSKYLDALIPYLEAYAHGRPIDGNSSNYEGPGTYIPGTQDNVVHYEPIRDMKWYLKRVGISFIVGAVVSCIVLLILRSQMNTTKAQKNATSYMLSDSYRIELQQDIFLYSQIRKERKSENSSGGGSSVHRSSSGRSHGGGHGKF